MQHNCLIFIFKNISGNFGGIIGAYMLIDFINSITIFSYDIQHINNFQLYSLHISYYLFSFLLSLSSRDVSVN